MKERQYGSSASTGFLVTLGQTLAGTALASFTLLYLAAKSDLILQIYVSTGKRGIFVVGGSVMCELRKTIIVSSVSM